jgi:hypothetical protein
MAAARFPALIDLLCLTIFSTLKLSRRAARWVARENKKIPKR